MKTGQDSYERQGTAMGDRQWIHREPQRGEATCSSRGPEGWHCSLASDHDGPHAGFTTGFSLMSIWEAGE